MKGRAFPRPMVELSDDEAEEYAELFGVDVEDIHDLAETGVFDDDIALTSDELDDYLAELAELYDYDISDLYDMYYGYSPDES